MLGNILETCICMPSDYFVRTNAWCALSVSDSNHIYISFGLQTRQCEQEGGMRLAYLPLTYERVYLPLCQVADTPFHI